MSNPANSISFFVRGQAANVALCVVSSTTGNPLSGGLAGLGAKVSKDDGSFAATTNAPVEIFDTDGTTKTGFVTLDLTATEMTASKVVVQVFSSSTGAVTAKLLINPLDLSGSYTERYDQLSILRFEQMGKNVHSYLWNRNVDDGAEQTIYNDDGFDMGHGTVIESNSTAERTKIG